MRLENSPESDNVEDRRGGGARAIGGRSIGIGTIVAAIAASHFFGIDPQVVLEPGELEQAITAAAAIGDDRLQKQARGIAVPESFTHGSSEQRVRWFRRGFDSADPRPCDTFRTAL